MEIVVDAASGSGDQQREYERIFRSRRFIVCFDQLTPDQVSAMKMLLGRHSFQVLARIDLQEIAGYVKANT